MLPLVASRCPGSVRSLGGATLLRALSVIDWNSYFLQKRQIHASAPANAPGGPASAVAAAALAAFSPLEGLGSGGISPIILGTSVWELMHSATGLPWWASIPLTTLALRTVLLPLTIKARASTVNFALMRQATAASHVLWERMQQEQQAAQAGDSSSSSGSSSSGSSSKQSKAMTRNQLTKQYFMYMRKQHCTPSMWWYSINALVQVNVFLSMSASLRQMSAMMWPGFDTQGLAWFVDMTKPAVEWGTWGTPYGVAGMLLPLAVFGAYVRTLEYTSVADRPRARAIMELLTFPMFLAAMVVPHSTVLYWLTNGLFGMGLQAALGHPKVAAAVGLPMLAVHTRDARLAAVKSELERRQVEGAVDASDDPAFVRYLAADTLSRGQNAAAAACLKRLTMLAPEDPNAWRQLGAACGKLGRWPAAAEAHARAGELLLAAAKQGSSGSAGGGDSGGDAAAGRELVSSAVAWLNAASVKTSEGGEEGAEVGAQPAASKLAHVGRALEMLHKAEVEAGLSDALTWYYTCMGRLATGQFDSALDAMRKSWEHARGEGAKGGAGKGGRVKAEDVKRLVLPLVALIDKVAAQGVGGTAQLLQAGEFAREVAGSGNADARAALVSALIRASHEIVGADAASKLQEIANSL